MRQWLDQYPNEATILRLTVSSFVLPNGFIYTPALSLKLTVAKKDKIMVKNPDYRNGYYDPTLQSNGLLNKAYKSVVIAADVVILILIVVICFIFLIFSYHSH